MNDPQKRKGIAMDWKHTKDELPEINESVLVCVIFDDDEGFEYHDSSRRKDGTWHMGSAKNFTVEYWCRFTNPYDSSNATGEA
jgi:hypothetical protein